MTGWKTYAGALIVAIAAVLRYFGMDDAAEALMLLGGALIGIGLRHKMERMAPPPS
jgi:hypothetical protein